MLKYFLLREIKEGLKLGAYSKPAKFKFKIDFKITNLLSTQQKIDVVLPAPRESKNQKIISSIKTTPNNMTKKQEKNFGNYFYQFSEKFEPYEVKNYSEEFLVKIEPKKSPTNGEYSVSEYKINEQYELYANTEPHINFKIKEVEKLNLLPKTKDVLKIAKHLNDIVVRSLKYGDPIDGLYSLEETLSREKVDCGGFSVLLVALLRKNGIPSRVISGFLVSKKSSLMHAWVEFMLPDGVWISADPTIENLLKVRGTTRSGRFGFVGSDHLTISVGSDIKLNAFGKEILVDILQNPMVFANSTKSFAMKILPEAELIS